MKRRVFSFLLLVFVVVLPGSVVHAAYTGHDAVRDVYFTGSYTVEFSPAGQRYVNDTYVYTFTTTVFTENEDVLLNINPYDSYLYHSTLQENAELMCMREYVSTGTSGNEATIVNQYLSDVPLEEFTEQNFYCELWYRLDGSDYSFELYYELEGDMPDVTPIPTATPVPTATPIPSPTATPRPTSTPVPTATPRPTLTPAPTATPRPTATPTPLPEPVVQVNVTVNGYDSTSTYFTGGCDSISSYFELQWFTDGIENPYGIYRLVKHEDFVDGRGVCRYTLTRGEWYRAMVSYTYYDTEGIEQTKTCYSDFFQADDGNSPVVIWNLKSLMQWIWNDLMEISITYEGFTVTFKQIFLFTMIAPTLIYFVFCLAGICHGNFMLTGRGPAVVEVSDPVTPEDQGMEDIAAAFHNGGDEE